MRNLFKRSAQFLVFWLLAFGCPLVQAQDAENLTFSNLLETATGLIDAQEYIQARPFLLELVNRFKDEGEQERESLEAVYLYLGIGYMVEYSGSGENSFLTKAIEWFDRLNKEFPNGGFAVESRMFTADAYRGLQQFGKAADVYENLMTPPLELRMRNVQRLEVLEKLNEALYITKSWERGLKWFRMFLNESGDSDDRAAAAAALLEANIQLANFDEALQYLRFLVGESPSRYKLQLNVALIDAGDRLAEQERYTEAMLMYRLVLTVDQIVAWQRLNLADLQQQLDRLRITTADANNEQAIELETQIFNGNAQLEALEKLDPYTSALKVRIARNYLQTNRDWESFYAYRNIIKEYPDHPNIEDFIFAAFIGATKIGKPDAVVELGEQYLADVSYSEYSSDVVVKLLEYYRDKRDYDEFFYLAKKFVNENPATDYASSVVFLLGSTYTQLGRYQEMIDLFKGWETTYPNTTMDPGLFYWIGLGMILDSNYSDAWEYFNAIVNDYPDDAYAEDALYRRGICYMGFEDYEAARQDFDTFVRKYPNTNLRGEVEYFLGEIDSATGNVESAIEHYSNVEKYTDNIAFIQNAYFQMGILLEANRQYADMAAVYQQFIDRFADRGELTGAIFQLGRAYELDLRPHLMLKEYLTAIGEYGDDPYTYGLDEILAVYPEKYYLNRDLINQNLELLQKLSSSKSLRKKLSEDRQALFEFLEEKPLIRENIKRALYQANFREGIVENADSLNPWLEEFEALSAAFPEETPEQSFERLYAVARDDGQDTLALRLQFALAKLGVEVDRDRVFSDDDFYYASPVVLVWMGQRMADYDSGASESAFELVLTDHPESDQVFNALIELGDLAAASGDTEGALQFYERAEADFPVHENADLALMRQADMFIALQRFDKAREKFRSIVSNRDWRGEAHAEALFKTGESFAAQGELKQALAFFERVYIGYPIFADWSSQAYLESGRILQQLGDSDKARETYDEFLQIETYEGTEAYPQIKQLRSAL